MKTVKIKLHLRRKSAIICVAAFMATFLLISLVVSISVGADLSQLNALIHSKYEYSATAQSSTLDNTYLQYTAGISFTMAEDSQTRLNVEVLMQTESSEYTDTIYWNSGKLSKNRIAMSSGIAKRHGLKLGDVVYSKHIVDGTMCEYTIEALVPDISAARIEDNGTYYDGIIIMGYDERYANNISHYSIIFTKESIESVAEKCSEMPTDILYRDNEIFTIAKKIAPYLIIFVSVVVACVVGVVLFLTKALMYNFKRLAMLGAEFKPLNRAYYAISAGVGILLMLLSGIISIIIFARVVK